MPSAEVTTCLKVLSLRSTRWTTTPPRSPGSRKSSPAGARKVSAGQGSCWRCWRGMNLAATKVNHPPQRLAPIAPPRSEWPTARIGFSGSA